MRDGNIYRMTEQMDKRLSQMYKQIQFLDTRQQAYERATHGFWNLFDFIFRRKSFNETVDLLQLALLKQHDQKLGEAIRQKHEEMVKPKLVLPSNGLTKAVAILLLFILPSCVSTKKYKEHVDTAYKEGYEANKFDCGLKLNEQDAKIKALTERLDKFNQVDEKGALRPLKRKWKGTASSIDPVEGGESWMK